MTRPSDTPLVRAARPSDAVAIGTVKRRLARPVAEPSTTREGFLLGCDDQMYARYIDDPGVEVWVLELAGVVAGFAIAFGDAEFRKSALWVKRARLVTSNEVRPLVDEIANSKLAYFDQLAVVPGQASRRWAPALAAVTFAALREHHAAQWVVATTVVEPFRNEASSGLLRFVNAVRVGEIAETYPDVGGITSAVFVIAVEPAMAKIREKMPRASKGMLTSVARFGVG